MLVTVETNVTHMITFVLPLPLKNPAMAEDAVAANPLKMSI